MHATISRRERQREQTREEIKATARRQMAEQGSAGLSLSAIARAMGLSTPALYYYFPDRDALLTALIVDAFTSLAEALEASVEPYPQAAHAEKLFAALLAYRAWALAHPIDFQLIYGTPVPNYAAPAEQTVPAVRRGFAVILRVLVAAHADGLLRPRPEHAQLPADLRFTLNVPGVGAVDPAVAYIALSGWTFIHGTIMLELFNHLGPNISSPEAFYRHQVLSFLAGIGLEPHNTA
jgi:AcrR family transcriptional regulator